MLTRNIHRVDAKNKKPVYGFVVLQKRKEQIKIIIIVIDNNSWLCSFIESSDDFNGGAT